ncbi:hypothetical protein [Actinokineospora inagensis]|uniref:hypothetical protein n=1 Tax=Actinokineospora inagensis TaxID=103730 RepID=UPI0003F81F2A|nr:hypothetical protein [Actinokineospora inagensis]
MIPFKRTAAAVASTVALMCVAAPTASAGNATLGSGCRNGWFTFTLSATGNIPAGSTWTSSYTAASPFPTLYNLTSSSSAITVTNTGRSTASLVSTAVIPAGTTVYLQPYEYPLTSKSALTLYISGYGGSTSAYFPSYDGEVDTTC